MTRADFFAALFDGCDGLLELRALPSKAQAFTALGDDAGRERFITAHAGENVYFACATRRTSSSGALANCRHLPVLFADLDFKLAPADAVRKRLAEFPFPPSAVVASGGGLHVYWKLKEPVELPGEAVYVTGLLRRLALALPGGDAGSAEPAHILRVPATINWKPDYATPPAVALAALHVDRQYTAADFDDLLPEESAPQRSARFVAPDTIAEGQRNATLFAAARALRAKGLIHGAVLAALLAQNAETCRPPLSEAEVQEIADHAFRLADRPDYAAPRVAAAEPPGSASDERAGIAAEPAPEPALLGVGAGVFVARTYPPSESFVDGILSSDGGGWIGGEEKSGKSYYATEEALCLALALPVCGRFAVERSRRILFVEEEDPPRRMHGRFRALLRGHGLDPDDATVQEALDRQLLVSVWEGVTLDDPAMLARLEATIAAFRPAVCYLDVLRKLTMKDLNKADQAGQLFAELDQLRRRYGVIFRILHHYRKQQGFRTGRGSQEIGGSFVLGAWGECSLFFEPIGRKQGAVRVEVQTKDGPPVPAFRLKFESEGPAHAPTLVRITAEAEAERQDTDEAVFQAIATLPQTEAVDGQSGVTRAALVAALKHSDRTVRRAIARLEDAGRILVTGHLAKQKHLYGVKE